MSSDRNPLVSVGIPTYNRARAIGRSIESALGQEYGNIELIISDDASVDDTESVCRAHAAADARVTYVRQARNIGLTRNFLEVLRISRGEFFLWLADDDWLDGSYVKNCMDVLLESRDIAVVSGLAHTYRNGIFNGKGVRMNLLQDSPLLRTAKFYLGVGDNCTLYGVMRKSLMMNCMMPNTLGGDWIFVAEMVFQGKILTLDNSTLHRERVGSTSASIPSIVRTLKLPATQRIFPFASIAIAAFQHVGYRSPVYGALGIVRRLGFASVVFCVLACVKAPFTYLKQIVIIAIGIERARQLKAFLLRTRT